MGKTSARVKNRYNEKAYDRIAVIVPKGRKTVYKAFSEGRGISMNAFIVQAVEREIERLQSISPETDCK